MGTKGTKASTEAAALVLSRAHTHTRTRVSEEMPVMDALAASARRAIVVLDDIVATGDPREQAMAAAVLLRTWGALAAGQEPIPEATDPQASRTRARAMLANPPPELAEVLAELGYSR